MLATTLLLAVLSAAPGAPAEAACTTAPDASNVCAPASPELRARVRSLLGAIHAPVSAETWQRLGPAAVPVLSEIATSGTELPFVRARAVEALAMVGGDDATATALRVAHASGDAWDVRASAVHGLGTLLAQERLVAELRPILERDPDAHVRNAAATVLAHRAGATGCAAVRAQATKESRAGRTPYLEALGSCR